MKVKKIIYVSANKQFNIGYKKKNASSSQIFENRDLTNEITGLTSCSFYLPLKAKRYFLLSKLIFGNEKILNKIGLFTFCLNALYDFKIYLPLTLFSIILFVAVIIERIIKTAMLLLEIIFLPWSVIRQYSTYLKKRRQHMHRLHDLEDLNRKSDSKLSKQILDAKDDLNFTNTQLNESRKDLIALFVPILCALIPVMISLKLDYTQREIFESFSNEVEERLEQLETEVSILDESYEMVDDIIIDDKIISEGELE